MIKDLNLRTSCINTSCEMFAYKATAAEGRGLEEILSMYLPRGPIRKLVTYFKAGGGMPLYVGHSEYYDFDSIVAYMNQTTPQSTGFSQSMFGGGKGYTIPNMFISGVAETFERALGAVAYFQKRPEIIYGTYKTLSARGYNCLAPSQIPLFAEEQYAQGSLYYERLHEDTFLGWIEGHRFSNQESVWMPAQIILPYYQRRADEPLVGYATTGGLACHISREEALFHGIMELIERDGVNIRWNCRVAPERIEVDRPLTMRPFAALLKTAQPLPVTFDFYLHAVDMPEVPVVTVIAFAASFNRYSYYAGGGVGLDTEEAMLYALAEYGQAEGTLRTLLLAPQWELAKATRLIFDVPEDIPVEKIDLFFKIISYYGYPKNAQKMHWYLNDGASVPLSALPQVRDEGITSRFQRLTQILHKYKIDPIVFDLTPEGKAQLRLMKVYAVELAPPYLQSLPLLGHPRYYEVPYKLGWSKTPLTYADLTTDPQPYP